MIYLCLFISYLGIVQCASHLKQNLFYIGFSGLCSPTLILVKYNKIIQYLYQTLYNS